MPKWEKALLTGLIVSMLFSAVTLRCELGHEIVERTTETSLGERWWGVVFSYPRSAERRKPGEQVQIRFRILEMYRSAEKNRNG